MIIVVQQVKPVVLESDPRVIVAGSTGLQGPGVPAGGTTGQALVKASNDDNDTEWADQTGGGAALSDDLPAALGAAAAGTGLEASRDDHIHAMPSAADVGAAAAAHQHAGGDITSAVASATNADTVDNQHAAAFAAASHAHAGGDITSGTVDGDRLPAMSETKAGAVPATGVPTGTKALLDDGTWGSVASSASAGALLYLWANYR